MIILTKRSKQLCIGHRLLNYHGLCANLHGHGLVVELKFEIPNSRVDQMTGLTIDFMEINEFMTYLDSLWDHGFLVNQNDTEMLAFLIEQRSKHYVFKGNPTMENLAREVISIADGRLSYAKVLKSATIFEKEGIDNGATYTRESHV